jgi:putative membrane protein
VHVSWMWLWGGLMMAVWLMLLVSIAWLISVRPGSQSRAPTDRAREGLAERYARGEIDAEEYRDRLGAARGAG